MFDQDHHDDAPRVAAGGAIDPQQRQWAMFAHLSALLGGLLTTAWGGSIGCFIGPLVIWLLKKDTMPFVGDQAKEALNFNITVAIIFLVLFLMTIFTLGIGIIITGPLFVVVGLSWLVFTIIAAIKANDGIAYRYPLTLRLIK
ncbi:MULTISPECIES: DUF4870 domain-containing protein [unclassified Luteimonas]|uniref:DUF4870 domain-containing protein n=1 Tax=unclassified Luteimonas TaxID=2629088 RepID=UPI00210736E0|nr:MULTISPECIES: DUF4870 domain-containing protein [unclassified Luteimonas]